MHDYRTIKIAKLLSYYYHKHIIKYCEKVYEMSGKNLFWSIKNSCEVLNKLKFRGFVHPLCLHTNFYILYYLAPKMYEKRKDFDFDIVNLPFLYGDVLLRHPMLFIFLNLFDLLEFPVLLMTLILVIRF